MTTSEINKLMNRVTSIEEQGRRRLYHIGQRFIVEATSCETNPKSTVDLMRTWKKNGYITKMLPSYIYIDTYYYDKEGNCYGRYNATVKPGGAGYVIDFDKLREATPENERELVAECIRLAVEAKAI